MPQKIDIKKGATVFDIIDQMYEHFDIHRAQGKKIAESGLFDGLNLYDSGKLIFDRLKAVNYVADQKKQKVKTPYRLMMDNKGDCKSYSIFAASILVWLTDSVRFIFCNGTVKGRPDHVFVEYLDTMGNPVYLDATICCFDKKPEMAEIWLGQWMQ